MTDGGEGAHAGLLAERRDLLGTVQAIRDAMHRINEAVEQLGHAEDVVTVESWGGLIVASSIKRRALERSAGSMRAVEVALEEVRERLLDIGIEDTASLVAGAAPGVSRRDRWLDGLLLGRHTRRQVRKAIEHLDLIARVLVRVQSTLNRRQRDLTEQIDAAQA